MLRETRSSGKKVVCLKSTNHCYMFQHACRLVWMLWTCLSNSGPVDSTYHSPTFCSKIGPMAPSHSKGLHHCMSDVWILGCCVLAGWSWEDNRSPGQAKPTSQHQGTLDSSGLSPPRPLVMWHWPQSWVWGPCCLCPKVARIWVYGTFVKWCMYESTPSRNRQGQLHLHWLCPKDVGVSWDGLSGVKVVGQHISSPFRSYWVRMERVQNCQMQHCIITC